jgi:hypothetical protein
MKTTEFLKENSIIAQEADDMHKDHEVQMARSQMYSAAQSAIEIHRLLKDISELEGLDGWVASKLTLASEYLETVRDYLKYEAVSAEQEMMAFAYESAEYAMDKLLVEKANKKFKEQTTPTIGGLSNTTDASGRTTQSYDMGPLSVSKSTGGGIPDVTSSSYELGHDKKVTHHTGTAFGGASKDVQPGGNQITTMTNSSGKTTNVIGRQPTKQDIQAGVSENNKKLKETASAGASGSSGVATSMGGPGYKPTSGVPKKLGNAHKPKKVAVGKGVY